MYTAADFDQAFADYVQYNQELIRNLSPTAGILGVLGFKSAKPENDPIHQQFFKEMKEALAEVAQSAPDAATADSIIEVIFSAKSRYAGKDVAEYMFAAIEGQTIDLIPYMSKEKTATLYEKYRKDNPWNMRVPVQKKVLAALKAAL